MLSDRHSGINNLEPDLLVESEVCRGHQTQFNSNVNYIVFVKGTLDNKKVYFWVQVRSQIAEPKKEKNVD
jgi:hypothetical protein